MKSSHSPPCQAQSGCSWESVMKKVRSACVLRESRSFRISVSWSSTAGSSPRDPACEPKPDLGSYSQETAKNYQGGSPLKRRRRDDALVYSSQHGKMCAQCGHPSPRCTCSSQGEKQQNSAQTVTVGRSSKGRKGKPVTTVSQLPLSPDDMRVLAADLKRRCGSGGTLKDGVIEIQGEHRDTLVTELEARGYRVVRSGG